MRNLLFLFILLSPFFCRSASSADQRPNVLMIVVDDMNDWVGCLGGHPQVKTPHIDRLAKRGMLFTNAHVAAPVCNPSRVATLTGLRPSTTGIYGNETRWLEALPDVPTIPQHFKRNGYHVAGGGKVNHHMPGFNRRTDWHDYFDQVFDSHYQDQLARGLDVKRFTWPAGFPLNRLEAVRTFSKPPQNPNEFDWGAFDKPDAEMGDGRMVEWAVKFLAKPSKDPFFLAAGIYRPHLPFYAPLKYFDLYPQDQIVLPPIKNDDCDDLPEAGKQMAANRRGDYELVLRENRHRELVQAYLASISFGDALIGRLIDALDASPAAKNTIIVFWSDHGWHLGEKQHLHKFTLWERSTRIPMIIAATGVKQPGLRTARPVGTIDLFPTLNELCSLPAITSLDGTSLVPLLKNPSLDWISPAITTHGQGNHALRTERWRYIRYADGSEELYDHDKDPNEWTNLADKPENAAKVAEFKALLQKEMAAYAHTTPLTVANPKPAEWTPPAPGDKADKPAKKAKSKAEAKTLDAAPATTAQPAGRIRVDSGKHFTNWDTNKDDLVTLEEFQLGQKGKKGLEATFNSYDKNSDGKLSREEYVDPRAK